MALIKNYNTQFGIVCNYHKIVKVEIQSSTNRINMMIAIYASKEAHDNDSKPLWHEYVEIPFDKFAWDPREAFYPLLKTYTQSYLQGAQDSIQPGQTVHGPVFELI